ncbi:unnamed protein product [Schistosoma mattheei]|uniref:Uncharacterized protein n=1 Tax=Schistosoma mattheei TaxID=31246 RepID=A0A183PPT7_9TREM|nr:unnamed protein product [Schistosoma mattheei]
MIEEIKSYNIELSFKQKCCHAESISKECLHTRRIFQCCKPDKLTNSMNRNKISFSHHDETKIWSTSLESETTREYGDLQNDNYEYDGNQNTITNSSAYIMQSIDDDTSSLDLETQEMDENKWCTMSNNVTSLTIEKKQT